MTDLGGVPTASAALAADLSSRAPAGTRITTLTGDAAPGARSSGYSVSQEPRPEPAADPYADGYRGTDLGGRVLAVVAALRAAVPEAEKNAVHFQPQRRRPSRPWPTPYAPGWPTTRR